MLHETPSYPLTAVRCGARCVFAAVASLLSSTEPGWVLWVLSCEGPSMHVSRELPRLVWLPPPVWQCLSENACRQYSVRPSTSGLTDSHWTSPNFTVDDQCAEKCFLCFTGDECIAPSLPAVGRGLFCKS